ncbi:hypothetical protein ACFC19_39965 [Streptomyces sp. NPDC056127]
MPNGRMLEASRSGHVVPLQDPELVIDTLRELVTSLSTDERGS